MAFIYMAGGWLLNVPNKTKDQVQADMATHADSPLEYEVLVQSGHAHSPMPIAVAAHHIAVVSDVPLGPGSQR